MLSRLRHGCKHFCTKTKSAELSPTEVKMVKGTFIAMGIGTTYFFMSEMGYFPTIQQLLFEDKLEVTTKVFLDIDIDEKPSGRIVLGLYGKTQPRTVENFKQLCIGTSYSDSGKLLAYKGSTFHRIIPKFMLQGGDFTKHNGTGGESIYGPKFDDEELTVKHGGKGTLSMANAGRDTNDSQFFITMGPTNWLNGHHTVFGKVLEGMEVLDAMESCGSSNGKVQNKVCIANCGVLEEITYENAVNEAKVEPWTREELLERQTSLLEVEKDVMAKKDRLDLKMYQDLMQDIENEKVRIQKELEK